MSDKAAIDPDRLEADPTHPLVPYAGALPPAPDWYEALRGDEPEIHRVDVQGAGIEVLAWGEVGQPGVLLVHGNRAHAHWWGPVGPLLAKDYRVASLSMSGTGRSDWRDHYSSELQTAELFAAIDRAGLKDGSTLPVIVAHSFGGAIAANAAIMRGRELGGLILVDTALRPNKAGSDFGLPNQKERRYPDLASALARFRLAPSQPCANPYILHDVACGGLVEEADGTWRWAFDPNLRHKLDTMDPWPAIANPPCPIAFVYGEQSALMSPAFLKVQRNGTPPGVPFIGIPQAWHHVMFDQPFALVAALRALVGCWLGRTRLGSRCADVH